MSKKNKHQYDKNEEEEAGEQVTSTTSNKKVKMEIEEEEVEQKEEIEQNETVNEESEEDSLNLDSIKKARKAFPKCARDMFAHAMKDFTKPSPIQAQSWGPLLKRRDLVGIASTGSGKTLAFVLPAVALMLKGKLSSNNKKQGKSVLPSALVLSPTRELCIQIFEVCKKVCVFSASVKSCVVYGGVDKFQQQKEVEKGVDFLVATPGRLLDFLEMKVIDLSLAKYLVLDEADRMLDMGFERDVRRIVSNAPEKGERQTLMFSATWPSEIRSIASEFLLPDAVKVVLTDSNHLQASKSVTQHVEVLSAEDVRNNKKEKRLMEILNDKRFYNKKIIIFALYKKEAERLEGTLLRKNLKVAGVHGDKNQRDREQNIAKFVNGEASILVATDVASRGLDIDGVELVVNYTFPLTIEDYVHRIGRTGRAGKTGEAITFFTDADKLRAGELQNVLKQAGVAPPEALLKFGATVKKKEHDLYGAHFKKMEDGAAPKKIVFGDDD